MSDFNLVFPIQKIDKVNRIVTGIATADNVDYEDDVISFEGSVEAFSNWIGNIREMHQPVAVGKLVDWTPVPVIYKGNRYDGIEVSVYISKGAEDTWQKILDGTLRGFSIGGAAIEKERVYREDLQRTVNLVKRYILGELSVVDNPCNPAGMFSMIKSVDGKLEYVAEQNHIFYCVKDDTALINAEVCPVCMDTMPEIGFAETLEDAEINKMISTFKTQEGAKVMSLQKNDIGDNVNTMSEEFTEEQKLSIAKRLAKVLFGSKEEEQDLEKSVNVNAENGNFSVKADGANGGGTVIVNIGAPVMHPDNESPEEDQNENTSEVMEGDSPHGPMGQDMKKSIDGGDEVTEDSIEEGEIDMDFEKAMEAFGAMLDEKLEKVKSDIATEVDAKIEKSVSEVKEEVTAEVTAKSEALTEEIEKVANTGAVSKSVEIADEDEIESATIEKSAQESFWGGIFVPGEIASALGYDS